MDISELKQKELPSIPDEIKKSIAACNITLTPFDRKNDVLCKSSLQMEAGYGRFSDGSYLVSMYCPMSGLTAEMVAWWFLVASTGKRTVSSLVFPCAHFGIGYPRRCAGYFEQENTTAISR